MFGHGFFRISYLVLILNCAQLQVHFKNCTSATTLELHKGGDISLLSAHTQHFLHLGIRNNNAPRSKFFSTSENLGESILCRIYVYSTTITIRIWTYSGIQRRHHIHIGQKTKVVAALLLVKRKFKVFPHKKHQGPCNDCWHVECCPRTLLDGRYVIMIREGPLLPPQRQIQPWVVDVLGCILIKVFFSLCV